jgi:hypothetical protein
MADGAEEPRFRLIPSHRSALSRHFPDAFLPMNTVERSFFDIVLATL